MTSPLSRSRSRRAPSHIAVRVAHVALGGLVAVGWLVLPLAGAGADGPAAVARSTGVTAPPAAAPQQGTSTGDLVPPLVAVGAAGALAAYGYARRRRRATTRTTPGGGPEPTPLHELDRQGRQLLVDIDDCVRVGAEELGLAADRSAGDAVEPYVYALRHAEAELATAFLLRQRLDEAEASGRGPAEDDSREVLEEIVARCQDAGRRLDAAAPGFDQLRALERNAAAALEAAETRFRDVTARTPAAEVTLADLHKRYAPATSLPVVGDVEQAKDRLVFTTFHLNQARQYADRGDGAKAAAHLRAAEGAVGQAADLVDGVDRLAAELASAAAELPAALTAVESVRNAARERARDTAHARPSPASAVLVGQLGRTEALLCGVRQETAAGPYDPLDALRRVVGAAEGLAGAGGGDVPDGPAHALLPARSALLGAAGFIGTHRGAVGSEARTRLAEAARLLGSGAVPLAGVRRADELAREARRLAERDVRAYGNPAGGLGGAGAGGAVLGGVLLSDGDGGPVSYGGPRTRGRRSASFT
ncbi:hypothetical protein [Streptomyces sp. NBC_00728]|uniref:hypothetical protein n=1 Tax=Streptomyces sp. NBC_00728 TaxID=2903676 RepID=UPI00386EBEC7